MPFPSRLIIRKRITCGSSKVLMTQLFLQVKQITPLPYPVNGMRVPEIVRPQMRQAPLLTAPGQCLPSTPASQRPPLAAHVADKQRINSGRQGQAQAHPKPAFKVFSNLLVKVNNSIPVCLSAPNMGQSVALLNRHIVNGQAGNLTHTQAGIKGQTPEGQGANIQPVAVTLAGRSLEKIKKLLQIVNLGRSGNRFRVRWLFGQCDGVGFNLAAPVKPVQPQLEDHIVAVNAGDFQAARFAAVEEGVNRFWRDRPGVRAGKVTKEVKNAAVALESLRGSARLGFKKNLDVIIQGCTAVVTA